MRRKERAVTDLHGIRTIIEMCTVCHVAMVDDGMPYVLPLNFGFTLEDKTLSLFFHSAKVGRKIDILKKNNAVCFEMSHAGGFEDIQDPCNAPYYFDCVHGFGHVEFIEDATQKCEALTLLMRHQAKRDFVFTEKNAECLCVYKIVSNDFIGKRKAPPHLSTHISTL